MSEPIRTRAQVEAMLLEHAIALAPPAMTVNEWHDVAQAVRQGIEEAPGVMEQLRTMSAEDFAGAQKQIRGAIVQMMIADLGAVGDA